MATTIVISEASIQGTNATYHIIVQEKPTVALLDTRANISEISQNFFESLPQKPKFLKLHMLSQKPKFLKLHMHKLMSASGDNLGLIGHSHHTFSLGNKSFTDKFIVHNGLWKNLFRTQLAGQLQN